MTIDIRKNGEVYQTIVLEYYAGGTVTRQEYPITRKLAYKPDGTPRSFEEIQEQVYNLLSSFEGAEIDQAHDAEGILTVKLPNL